MELWIRSQDKDFIMKVNNIILGYQNDVNNKGINELRRLFTFTKDTAFTLGVYQSKERALEVLDEIQEFIENKGKIKITQDINGITSEVEDAKRVYQMPLE